MLRHLDTCCDVMESRTCMWHYNSCRNKRTPQHTPSLGLEPRSPELIAHGSVRCTNKTPVVRWTEFARVLHNSRHITHKTAPQRSPSPGLEPRPSWQPTTLASGSYILHYNSRQDLHFLRLGGQRLNLGRLKPPQNGLKPPLVSTLCSNRWSTSFMLSTRFVCVPRTCLLATSRAAHVRTRTLESWLITRAAHYSQWTVKKNYAVVERTIYVHGGPGGANAAYPTVHVRRRKSGRVRRMGE